MMLLSHRILEVLYPVIKTNIIGPTDVYPLFAPDSAVFPFLTMIPISSNKMMTFKGVPEIEKIIVQFSVFDNNSDESRIQLIKGQLEQLLHTNCYGIDFTADNEGHLHISGIKKVSEPRIVSGSPAENFYKHGLVEFEFTCTLDKCVPITTQDEVP